MATSRSPALFTKCIKLHPRQNTTDELEMQLRCL
ncbi:hypothetical protein BVRB_2g036240 [Beta vulgaris subsp. vulgaris]|nr:hypothetical protein BVRB_2g036240 [Beta vulgaris subsp. vulgaris]